MDKVLTAEKADNYRSALGRFVGHEVILECSDFRMITNERGEELMVLEHPKITKIRGVNGVKPFEVGHLWIHIPGKNLHRIRKYRSVARKLRIEGRIHEYVYKEAETVQVGVKASAVHILKYKKEIAKMFHLKPGDRLTSKQLNYLRIEENRKRIRSELAAEQEELRRIAIAAALHKKKYPYSEEADDEQLPENNEGINQD